MTYEQLKRYRSLEISIQYCDGVIREIDELADGLTDNASLKKLQRLKAQQLNKRREAVYELARLTEYINGIKDEEMKDIFITHFICGENYRQISERLFCDRSTIQYKVQKYLYNNSKEQSKRTKKTAL